MERYLDVAIESWLGYARYLWRELTQPGWGNYVYLLLAASLLVALAEVAFPWRPRQRALRDQFGLDLFYLGFNFFGFSLLGYAALSDVVATAFGDGLSALGIERRAWIDVSAWPAWGQLAAMLVLRDLVHYGIHRLMHRVPALWRIHEVHHSARVMSFAAHLRFHPLETVVYRTLEYLPLALLGFGLREFFIVHAIALVVGHLNHANLRLPLGPLRYVLNSSQMHLWHHAAALPAERAARHRGVNFGLTLSLWDYLFGTAYVPAERPDLELGFEGAESFPRTFLGQLRAPFRRRPS